MPDQISPSGPSQSDGTALNNQVLSPAHREITLVRAFDPDRGHPSFALLQGKAHALPLIQLAQPRMLHSTDMHENIIAPFIGRDKPIAFAGVEPFDDSRMGFGGLVYLPS